MRSLRLAASLIAASTTVVAAEHAAAGEFDSQGNFAFDHNALMSEGFETLPEYVASEPDAGDIGIKGLVPSDTIDALEGKRVALVQNANWWEYAVVPVQLPARQVSVRARLWTRHQNVVAMFVARFNTRSNPT